MKAVIYALRSFGRELRSGEVIVLLAAVALAVAALTAVGFLTDRIGRAVARQANEVLAADLRLRTPDPIPAEWHEMAADHGLQSAETQRFPSVVFAGDLSSLSAVMGVATYASPTASSASSALPRAYRIPEVSGPTAR
jgi:putative ABC transport system permease protein